MNLVKWFRKNRTKVMAIVVIVLMIAFIGGSALDYLLSPRQTLGHKAVAYFGDNKKITSYDLALARQELEILMLLRADDLLRSQDLTGVLLAELLFSENRAQAQLFNRIKQIIRANQYRISDKQITDIYRRSWPSNVYWLLLKNEAQLAGIRITNDDAGQLLARVIPQLFDSQTYSQRMVQLVNRYGVPEAQILATFGKLLAIYQYAHLICETCDVTSSQLMHMVSFENETIDVEFVKFDSTVFCDSSLVTHDPCDEPLPAQGQARPRESGEATSDEELLEHFNKYKNFFAGDVSEENPYGFGYKLPDRLRLEYIAVKLDDISPQVSPPTSQETEEYYQKHTELFTESVPQDPNDPNSPLIKRTRSYAEMASIISRQLLKDKIDSKAENILQEAGTLTEAEARDPSLVTRESSDERRATDYQAAAKELAKNHKIKIYAGQTGLLSAADMEQDENLRRLYVLSQERESVRLTQVVFSIDELAAVPAADRGPLDVPKPKVYENIGPAKDMLGKIMVMVRVTKAEKASEPQSIDSILDNRSLTLVDEQASSIEKPVSRTVKDKVAQDLKKLALLRQGLLKNKAQEFIDLAGKDGWQAAVDKFNQLYRHEGQGTSEPNVFRLENSTNLQRISGKTLATLAAQSEGNPGQWLYVRQAQKRLTADEAKIESKFIEQLYSLLPPDSNTVGSLPVVMEFKPNMSFYVIKSIAVKRLEQQEYEKIKARQLFTEDHIQSQSLAPVHFNPENILKRMNFRPAGKDQKQTESATADKSQDAS